jgi:hypothetical protein
MKNGLFNVGAYGLPAGAAEGLVGRIKLQYGLHAFRASRDDRYGRADLPDEIEPQAGDVVEVEVANGNPVKAVIRYPYDDVLDLVLVVIPGAFNYFVKTVWFNAASDNHRTLRLAPYSRP